MFSRVIKRSRSMREWRVGPAAGDVDVDAHGPRHNPSTGGEHGQASVSGPALHDASWQAVHNAEASLYLDRPLPPPPPPKTAAPVAFAMPARPSTSGGPNAKASAFLGLPSNSSAADKRISRDDMFLTKSMGSKRGLQPYRVGVRGGPTALPTPEASPEIYYPLSPPSAIPARMQTPDTLSSGEIQIGMALGSPAHPPEAYSGWQPRAMPAPQPPLTPPEPHQPLPAPTVQRQKTQRRKLFGNLFGSRKHAEQAKASPDFSVSNASLSTVTSTGRRSGESTPARSNTVAGGKAPRHKPIIIRSNTEPFVDSSVNGSERGGRTQRWQPVLPQKSEERQNNYLSPDPPAPLDSTSVASPFLDIEIPNIKLERYSIMFGSVLNSEASSSSLLARRQATLEKLKTINDRILKEEEDKERMRQRRATSPQPTKSPGFTLFPPTPNRQGPSPLTPRRLDSRMQSYTSPANLPSPSRPSFDHEAPPRKEKKTVTIISPRTMEQRNQGPPPPPRGNEARESNMSTTDGDLAAFHFGPEVSGLILDSPQSITSPDDNNHPSVIDAHPLRPTIPEPEWQMIPGPAAASPPSSTTTSTRRSPSSSASSVNTHITRPSLDIDESDSALKAAVEISIARQISVSRQQRTLLRPLRTDIAQRPRPGARVSPVDKVNISRKEGRVVETKSGTPTVVVARDTLESYPAAHRKSERVVLEGL